MNATLPADINKKFPKMVSTVDCGTGLIGIPVGDSYECKGTSPQKKDLIVTLTNKPDGLSFAVKPK